MTTTTQKQTLKQALFLARTGKSKALARAARALHGKPGGGWADTAQAHDQMVHDLPITQARSYTTDEWVEATHRLDPDPDGRAAGIWRARELSEG